MTESGDEEGAKEKSIAPYILYPGYTIGTATKEELEEIYRGWDEERAKKAKSTGAVKQVS